MNTETNTLTSAATEEKHRKTIAAFSAAWDAGDVDTLLSLMSDEPVYKGSAGPGPGTVFVGKEEVRGILQKMVGSNSASSDEEKAPATPPEMYFFANRALVYWRIAFPDADGNTTEVDGVDVMTFTDDGRIAVKDAYRKAFS
jgi:hypothetical protein